MLFPLDIYGTDSLEYVFDTTGFNRLMSITKNEETYTSYTYDDRGNQIQEVTRLFSIEDTHYDKTTDYGYDLADMLSEVKISTPEADGQGGVTYRNDGEINGYNASGQRVTRLDGQWTDADSDGVVDPEELSDTTTTNFYYTGGATLYTTNSNNYLTTENVLDLGGSIIASARFDEYEGYYFYNYDMRGSTTAILQPDGSLITGYEYDEFGNLEQSGDAEFLNDVTFTGSVSDTSTGLQYMNARYYNPETGRFLSQDTYSGNPYDPWTQHLYSYCGNNPTSMIDPTGHAPKYIPGMPSDVFEKYKKHLEEQQMPSGMPTDLYDEYTEMKENRKKRAFVDKWLIFKKGKHNSYPEHINLEFAYRIARFAQFKGKGKITISMGYRSYEEQKWWYYNGKSYEPETGKNPNCARPGTSWHEVSMAMDVGPTRWLKKLYANDKTEDQEDLVRFELYKPLTKGNRQTPYEDWHIEMIETADLDRDDKAGRKRLARELNDLYGFYK